MNTLIVDDVKLSRDGLSTLINKFLPEANIVGSTPSIIEARKILKTQVIDLVFLDIQLQDGLSFALLEDVSPHAKVIFITAYEKYAIDALRQGAFDYLLKPINIDDLKRCIERIHEQAEQEELLRKQLNRIPPQHVFREKIGISSMDGIEYVDTRSIIFLKADGKYTLVYLVSNQLITSSKNLKMFESILPENLFMRVHHSYLVNMSEIQRFKKEDAVLVLSDGVEIPVSKSRKDMLVRRLLHV